MAACPHTASSASRWKRRRSIRWRPASTCKALAICTMTDCLITKEELSAADRQSSLKDMVTLALDVAIQS